MLCEHKTCVFDEYTCTGPYDLTTKTFNGYCEINHMNGDIFKGYVKHNLYDGYGVLCSTNGDEYKGSFKNSLYHGKGILDKKNIFTIYDGEWENGMYISL